MRKIFILHLFLLLCYEFNGQDIISGRDGHLVIEGQGVIGVIELNFKRRLIKRKFGRTEKCYGVVGSFVLDESEGIINDTRRTLYRRWRNLYCYPDLGLEILFLRNRVNSMYFKSKNFVTQNGISVGDTRAKMWAIYGGEGDSPKVIYYDLGIAFVFKNDVIQEIEVFKAQGLK